jgi:phosphate-selective porin OprO and OprP
MSNSVKLVSVIYITTLASLLSPLVHAQTVEQRIEALEAKIRLLEDKLEQAGQVDQKVRVLERKAEIVVDETTAAKKVAPVVRASNTGFAIESADAKNSIRLAGVFQSDYRYYDQGTRDIRNRSNGRAGDLDTNGFSDANNSWLLRRVRPTIQGTLFGKYDFRTTFELGGGSASAIDAYIDARLHPGFKIRAGKFKPFVSLERLQAAQDIKFLERSYVSNAILPSRDLGIAIYGDVLGNRLNYAFGLNNGVTDGGNASTGVEFDGDPEYTARLFASPFSAGYSALTNLGFGVAVTYTDYRGERNLNFTDTSAADAARNGLPPYLTNGQNTFFRYSSAAIADGVRLRFAPQANYYYGPLGIIAEYASVKQDVSLTTGGSPSTGGAATNTVVIPGTNTSFTHEAWEIAASYLLTGEDASYRGVKPNQDFDFTTGGWGAWELLARYSEINLDEAAFQNITRTSFSTDTYANLSESAAAAHSWTVGVNWWLNPNTKLALNYEQTLFDGGAGDGILPINSTGTNVQGREDERAILTRLQLAY